MHLQIFVLSLMICASSAHFVLNYVQRPGVFRYYKSAVSPTAFHNVNVSINRRFGVGQGDVSRGETEMCKTRTEHMKTPTSLFSDGETGIIAEYCVNPGGSCELKLSGVSTTCVQKYIYKTRFNGTASVDEFKVPAGCVCKYK